MTAIILTKENFGKKVEYLYKKVLSQPKGITLYTDTPTSQRTSKVKLERNIDKTLEQAKKDIKEGKGKVHFVWEGK